MTAPDLSELVHRVRTEAHKARTLIIRQPVIDRWALHVGHLLDEVADVLPSLIEAAEKLQEVERERDALRGRLGSAEKVLSGIAANPHARSQLLAAQASAFLVALEKEPTK